MHLKLGIRALRADSKRERVLLKPHRLPEGNSCFIVEEHFKRESLIRRHDLFAEDLNGSPANAPPTMSTNDIKLPEIDALFGGTKQGVRDRLRCKLEDNCPVVLVEPSAHSFSELAYGHRIGGSFVLDELVIQLSEELDVFV